jgi:hypothetical protein
MLNFLGKKSRRKNIMNRYYSESKLFVWLRKKFGINKPEALGWGEWETYNNNLKAKKPFAFWLTDTLPDLLEKPAEFLIDPLYECKYYLRNRFVSKTHLLRTGLKAGQFHEFENKVLYGLFAELVDFVEIEKAHMQVIWSKEHRDKYSRPKWHKYWLLRWSEWRCPEAGLDHLKWEAELKFDENNGTEKGDPQFNNLTPQAESAIWLMSAYNWWKNDRPLRVDPYDASGITEFHDKMKEKYGKGMWMFNDDMSSEDKAEEHVIYERVSALEKQYADEDTKWLKEVIDHRNELWT